MIFTLRGIVRDGSDIGKLSGVCKFFTRAFIVVPKEDGKMAIMNDDLVLTPITQERLERYGDHMKKIAEKTVIYLYF